MSEASDNILIKIDNPSMDEGYYIKRSLDRRGVLQGASADEGYYKEPRQTRGTIRSLDRQGYYKEPGCTRGTKGASTDEEYYKEP